MQIIEKRIEEHLCAVEQLKASCIPQIEQFATHCVNALRGGRTIYFCGNGGSAADSQHLAAEIVGRFQTERRGYPSVALTTDTSILTSVSNDYGYENVFARQVEALVKEGDVLVGFSTSGTSRNVVAAIKKANELGAVTIGMTGKDGKLIKELATLCVEVPSDITARIQEAHILIGHIVCEMIDNGVASNAGNP